MLVRDQLGEKCTLLSEDCTQHSLSPFQLHRDMVWSLSHQLPMEQPMGCMASLLTGKILHNSSFPVLVNESQPQREQSQCNEIQEWTVISRKSFGFSCPPYLCLCCMGQGEVRAWACTCCRWLLTVETSFWGEGFTGNLASVLRGNFA